MMGSMDLMRGLALLWFGQVHIQALSVQPARRFGASLRSPPSPPPGVRCSHRHRLSLSSQTQQRPSSVQAATTAADSTIVNGHTTAAAAASSVVEQPSLPVVLWRFTRPHTLIGSALAIPALHFLAAPSLGACLQPSVFASIMFCMLPSLLMNLYITGLNQITDVEIDRINKPTLPIAAGILSKRRATAIVLVSLAVSLGLGALPWSSPGLNLALWGSAVLGTMYSLEPVRLKRFPLWAAFCIVAVRGTIINAGFYAHARARAFAATAAASGPTAATSTGVLDCLLSQPACGLSSLFFCIFGVVIALMKDVPDVAGDVSSDVRTLSVRLGQRPVFDLGRRLLVALFGAVAAGFAGGALRAPTAPLAVARAGLALFAAAGAASVRSAARAVDPQDSRQVYDYYMHLWKWFYLSYLALPFAR